MNGPNLVVLFGGWVVSAAVGLSLAMTMRRSHRKAQFLSLHGTVMPGRIESAVSVGRYSSHRRVTIAVVGGSFVETVPFMEGMQTGWEAGATISTQVVAGPPLQGRIARPVEPDHHVALGVAFFLFSAVLITLCAFVI